MTDKSAELLQKLDEHLNAIAEVCIPAGMTIESPEVQGRKLAMFNMTIGEMRTMRAALATTHD